MVEHQHRETRRSAGGVVEQVLAGDEQERVLCWDVGVRIGNLLAKLGKPGAAGRRIDLDTHREVFGWVLNLLADRGLLKGQRIAIDATTLEANAAMCAIVRRDTGESYEEFLQGLAKASGIATPTREDLVRLDRKRKKRMSNEEWKSPSDGDARIAKMKDGRTHLAHKAEHAVDLDTGAVVAVTLQGADQGDTTTLDATLSEAGMAVAELVGREAELRPDDPPKVNVHGIEEVVADKGYHSGAVVERVKSYEVARTRQ